MHAHHFASAADLRVNDTNSDTYKPPLVKRGPSLPDIRSVKRDPHQQPKTLKNAVMHLKSLPNSPPPETLDPPPPDHTDAISDQLLLRIFSLLPRHQHVSASLVCKRWMGLAGRLVRSVKLADWDFLDSGRVVSRFPNLTDIDLVSACVKSPRNSGIVASHKLLSFHLDASCLPEEIVECEYLLPASAVDEGLRIVASAYPGLRRLVVIGASEKGLLSVAAECSTLQELELHYCTDMALKGISGCKNLQILKLIGSVDGLYANVVSDIGFTILAQGCGRLVKLELSGCEGSYAGVKAIAQCCPMLMELIFCDHRMDDGWLSALQYFGNLRTLELKLCKKIDSSPGPNEHLGACLTLQELHLHQCQLRDKDNLAALFFICQAVTEIVLEDCWGLDDDLFRKASLCRRVKLLYLEGCSLLTMESLDSVLLSWTELERLKVISCNNIKDSDVTPGVAALFGVLRELKWRPDSKSLLSASLDGTGMGKKGGKFFKRV
uniref:F-box domain-containing protein n=1 Tax=Kalanchoe fedtschenkoi TaxID=63787 RepID=A0A7N0TDE8_KALFE